MCPCRAARVRQPWARTSTASSAIPMRHHHSRAFAIAAPATNVVARATSCTRGIPATSREAPSRPHPRKELTHAPRPHRPRPRGLRHRPDRVRHRRAPARGRRRLRRRQGRGRLADPRLRPRGRRRRARPDRRASTRRPQARAARPHGAVHRRQRALRGRARLRHACSPAGSSRPSCHGAFFGIGSVRRGRLVAPEKKAGAIAIMFTGLTAANVLGVPLGTLVGQQSGWRATFWAITVVGVVAAGRRRDPRPGRASRSPASRTCRSLRPELGRLPHPARSGCRCAMTVLGFGGMFGAFTYIALHLTRVTGFAAVGGAVAAGPLRRRPVRRQPRSAAAAPTAPWLARSSR